MRNMEMEKENSLAPNASTQQDLDTLWRNTIQEFIRNLKHSNVNSAHIRHITRRIWWGTWKVNMMIAGSSSALLMVVTIGEYLRSKFHFQTCGISGRTTDPVWNHTIAWFILGRSLLLLVAGNVTTRDRAKLWYWDFSLPPKWCSWLNSDHEPPKKAIR